MIFDSSKGTYVFSGSGPTSDYLVTLGYAKINHSSIKLGMVSDPLFSRKRVAPRSAVACPKEKMCRIISINVARVDF
ncbi:hypothetical protein Plhal703r1_c03g0017031 [Plasmopara halstedii]